MRRHALGLTMKSEGPILIPKPGRENLYVLNVIFTKISDQEISGFRVWLEREYVTLFPYNQTGQNRKKTYMCTRVYEPVTRSKITPKE
jgi:hypothetical protein